MKNATGWARFIAISHRIILIFLYLIFRCTLMLFSRLRYLPRLIVPPEVRSLKGPFIILADHVHPLDMTITILGLRAIVRWVATETVFRTPLSRFALTFLLGAVPKSKNRSDVKALSQLRLLADIGCVIGIYQEGELSWDGVNRPPVPGTGKLIRLLKIPVVYAHLEGAYLDCPRWSWSRNSTDITVRYELIIGRDEVREMPLSQIDKLVERAGTYDEWAYQARAARPLRGSKRAENVELVCFLCPGCISVGTLHSSANDFACTQCGLKGTINRLGSFEWPTPPKTWPTGSPFRNVREWNLWQMDFYKDRVAETFSAGKQADTLFWEDHDCVVLSRGVNYRIPKKQAIGTARLYADRIEFESEKLNLVIPLKDITGMNVFKQYYMEFYYNKELYRFTGTHRSVSGYKWLLLSRTINAWKKRAEIPERT